MKAGRFGLLKALILAAWLLYPTAGQPQIMVVRQAYEGLCLYCNIDAKRTFDSYYAEPLGPPVRPDAARVAMVVFADNYMETWSYRLAENLLTRLSKTPTGSALSRSVKRENIPVQLFYQFGVGPSGSTNFTDNPRNLPLYLLDKRVPHQFFAYTSHDPQNEKPTVFLNEFQHHYFGVYSLAHELTQLFDEPLGALIDSIYEKYAEGETASLEDDILARFSSDFRALAVEARIFYELQLYENGLVPVGAGDVAGFYEGFLYGENVNFSAVFDYLVDLHWSSSARHPFFPAARPTSVRFYKSGNKCDSLELPTDTNAAGTSVAETLRLATLSTVNECQEGPFTTISILEYDSELDDTWRSSILARVEAERRAFANAIGAKSDSIAAIKIAFLDFARAHNLFSLPRFREEGFNRVAGFGDTKKGRLGGNRMRSSGRGGP